MARRRAELRRLVPRRVEANLGSSSTRARSICSSSRNSSSESGTLPPALLSPSRPSTGLGPRDSSSLGSGWARAVAAFPKLCRSVSAQQARGPNGGLAEPESGPIDRPVGLRPAVLALTEDQLTLHRLARDQPLDPHPHQPDPGPLQPQGVVELQRRCGRSPGSRRWPPRCVRERVIVVKSANRTLMVTVRPATPATRIRPVTLVERRSSSRETTSRSSVSRPKVSSAPIDLSGAPSPLPKKPALGVITRRSVPQASSWRWVPRW